MVKEKYYKLILYFLFYKVYNIYLSEVVFFIGILLGGLFEQPKFKKNIVDYYFLSDIGYKICEGYYEKRFTFDE